MVNTGDPVISLALMILLSVVMGTLLLIAIAFIRRWKQIRYSRYVHDFRRRYRPLIAKVIAGAPVPSAIEALRELPLSQRELLLDPFFSARKLTRRQTVFLEILCSELGLIELWQQRAASGRRSGCVAVASQPKNAARRSTLRHLLHVKSIRNLGKLHHRQSWPLLVQALHDRRAQIQSAALSALALIGEPDSFPALCELLPAAVTGVTSAPPPSALRAAMMEFSLACAPSLLPLLRHSDRQVSLQALEILRAMVCREADHEPHLTVTNHLLNTELVDLALTELAPDTSAEIRACAADVIAYLSDARAHTVMLVLLGDRQWFVRLHAVRALSRMRHKPNSLLPEVCGCLSDPHREVREAAIHSLLSVGHEGRRQLFEHFLTTADQNLRHQIVEVIEQTGLMTVLVEDYSAGTSGVEARFIEQLANDSIPLGLSGVLRTLGPEVRQRFLDRCLPLVEGKMRFLEATLPPEETMVSPVQSVDLPPRLAA